MRKQFLAFLIVLLLIGCATGGPIVWIEKGVSLVGYETFEVMPVQNETGKTFEFNVANIILEKLKSGLKEKGYSVQDEKILQKICLSLKAF